MRFQDLFHSPHRGAFHPSLAVLFRYRSLQVLRLGGWSPLLPTAFHDSRRTRARLAGPDTPSPTGLSPSPVPPSSRLLLTVSALPVHRLWTVLNTPHNPARTSATAHIHPAGFGLIPVRSPLLGESFSFLGVLRCFSSPSSPLPAIDSPTAAGPSRPAGCPIRIPTALCVLSRSPWPFVARHVLPRPATPRHPPHTLSRLRPSPRDITCTRLASAPLP
jgi:hypothetical protein